MAIEYVDSDPRVQGLDRPARTRVIYVTPAGVAITMAKYAASPDTAWCIVATGASVIEGAAGPTGDTGPPGADGDVSAATLAAEVAALVAADAAHAALTQAHGISAFGATLVDDASAGTARTTLGLGTVATHAHTEYAAASHTHAAADITSGLAAVATSGSASDLGTGTLPAARIADGSVVLAKHANMTTARIVGRTTAGSGVPEELTAAQAKTVLAIAAGDVSGLAAVATSGSASDLGTGTLPIARVGANAVDGTKLFRGATSGHVLTSNGAGADPTYQAAAGGNDARLIVAALASDQSDITGTGLVEITGLTKTLGTGTYTFCFSMIYQTTATTTGVEFVVDHTGTAATFVSNSMFGSTGGTAATGIADQVGVGTAAGIMEVKTQRTKNSRPGVTIGVDTANANCLMIVEGVLVVTASGDLKIFMAAELAALVCRAKAGSSVVIVKTA